MSKPRDPPKHCCCCREHGHGAISKSPGGNGILRSPVPRSVRQSFPGSYNAAAKYLASGLVMDYNKLNAEFDEASKTTTENIMDILHDISSYDIFILERDATFDGRSGCSQGCNDCSECSGRRRARPDTKDLAHLQMSLRQLFDLIYQNFFHRILCPRKDQLDDAHMALVTPLHRVFIMHEQPKHSGWRKELDHFERSRSELVKLPLKANERLPKGCPASLCFSESQDIIDEFIDRVLCSTQVQHEKHNSTHHHTTKVTTTDDVCAICDRAAAWLLPPLVAPWFIHRNMMKRETLASLKRSPEITIPDSVINALENAPTNYPSFPPPPDALPTPPPKPDTGRKPKKSQTILMPNPPLYLGYLLPYYRLPFAPAKNPDPIKHPYSYFLSLDDQTRKTHLQGRVRKTREEMGFDQPMETCTPGPWKCGWFSATECGLHAEDWIMDKDKLVALQKLSNFSHLKAEKPWEKLQMTETEFFGKGGFEAWGKRIADAAEQMQNTPGGTAILRDVGALIETVASLPTPLPQGRRK